MKHYISLSVMAALHLAAMYLLMYAMVNAFANIYPNLNQLYMAGLMTAPMVVLELLFMRSMYDNVKANAAVIAAAILLFVVCFVFIRMQMAIGDKEFLRSMIPHHAGAILMCNEAKLSDPEIKKLCDTIVAGQQSEIDQMKSILGRLSR